MSFITQYQERMRRMENEPATIVELSDESAVRTQLAKVNIRLGVLETELRHQMQTAWMRGDIATADRIADLLLLPRPSEHEAKG